MEYPNWWKGAEPEIHAAVEGFVQWTRDRVANVGAKNIVTKKNPFLYRAREAKNINELADRLIDAFLSSSEETRFGDVLEEIAICICRASKDGWKSSAQGIDLEYDDGGIRTIMQIKSGINWGNSGSHQKLRQDFQKAKRVLHQGRTSNVRAVEGICYGPSQKSSRGDYFRIVGQDFWEDISNWQDSGIAVLDIIGEHAGNGLRDARIEAREKVVEFLYKYNAATDTGKIRWAVLFDLVMAPTGDWRKWQVSGRLNP